MLRAVADPSFPVEDETLHLVKIGELAEHQSVIAAAPVLHDEQPWIGVGGLDLEAR